MSRGGVVEGPVAGPPPRPPASRKRTPAPPPRSHPHPAVPATGGSFRWLRVRAAAGGGMGPSAHVQWSSASASMGRCIPCRAGQTAPSGSPTAAPVPNDRRTRSRPSPGPWSWAPTASRATPGSPRMARWCSTMTASSGRPWRRRPIGALSRAALPSHIPSLAELYDTVGTDFELSLDVKDPAALQPIVSGGESGRGDCPAVALPRGPGHCWPPGGRSPAGPGWSSRLPSAAPATASRPGFADWRQAGVDAVNLHRRQWSPERVHSVHRAGLWALAWDAQRRADITVLLDWGVDGVFSDHVDVLMAEIERRSR